LIQRILLIPIAFLLIIHAAQTSVIPGEPIATSGTASQATAPFDALMTDLLNRYEIPGGALALSRDGKPIVARGYGYADRKAKRLVQPDSLFRIASVSKPITAVAVLKLIDDNRLALDDHALDVLGMKSDADPRIADVTIRQLLLHSAGWDRAASFDPMFHFGLPRAELIIREMLKRRLDFEPGQRHAYSNFGYCVLGRIIERVSGTSYEGFVREHVLRPMQIDDMRIGGKSGNAPGEVHYYGNFAYGLMPDVMDAHGGWIASAPDLVRFADAALGRGTAAFLKTETLAQMTARPAPPLWPDSNRWYGLGWSVVPAQSGVNLWHNGAMPGTASLLVCAYNGYTWAAVFNQMPPIRGPFMTELDRGLWEALRTAWPSPPKVSTRRQ